MKRLIVLVSVMVLGPGLIASPAPAAGLGLQVDPLPASTAIHSALFVTGTAPLLRPAVLQVERGGRWTTIAGPSAAGARFSFRVPTRYYGPRVLRVVAPASGLLGEVDGDPQRVMVHMRYRPAGTADERALLGNGYRWNPCRTVPYHVNLAGYPATTLRTVARAFAKVTEATGIRFRYAGATSRVTFGRAWTSRPARSGIYLTFATPRTVGALRGAAGLGGEAVLETTARGNRVVASAGVAINKQWWPRLRAGFRRGPSRGSLLLHEIGHTMGLMHTPAKPQVMYTTLGTWSRGAYGAGDLTGLERLGLDQGCLP